MVIYERKSELKCQKLRKKLFCIVASCFWLKKHLVVIKVIHQTLFLVVKKAKSPKAGGRWPVAGKGLGGFVLRNLS